MDSSGMSQAEMGAALSAAAYAEPPIKPKGLALTIIIIWCILAAIATIVVGLRVYVRLWMMRASKVWGWEDTFAILGYFVFTTSTIFAIIAAHYGLGTREDELNPYLMVRCAEYMLYSQVMYGFSMPLIKASVVFTLLRITSERKYRWSLYAMLFIASVMSMVGILASLLYCKPVRAYWNPLLGKCGDFMVVVRIGYAWTAVGIATDWAAAIIPYLVVRKLQMSRKKKTVVMIILGLAAIASVASIVRAPYLQYYLAPKDQLYWNGYIILWCLMESGLALIAVCLPALRKLFSHFLESSRTGSNNKSQQYISSNRHAGNMSSTPMDSLSPTGKSLKSTVSAGKWARLGDGNSSTSHIILHERSVTVETSSMSDEEKQVRGK